jgi:hypothetical protein
VPQSLRATRGQIGQIDSPIKIPSKVPSKVPSKIYSPATFGLVYRRREFDIDGGLR